MLLPPTDLAATLQGGQAFRWRSEGDAFVGAVGRDPVRLTRTPRGVHAETRAPRAALASYLRIERSDTARRARLANDPAVAPALAAHPGLRLLRQDPWETTVAFVTSANNHVLRIAGTMRALGERWGERLDAPTPVHAFPAPDRLARATERDLRACGLGYRAPYLRETARRVARGDVDLHALRGAPLDEARASLLDLPGVGPKVADCIALFSLDADDAFPIDRWVLRVVSASFFDGAPVKPRDVERFARERWGRDAGLAQQLLFHDARVRAGALGTRRAPAAGGAPA